MRVEYNNLAAIDKAKENFAILTIGMRKRKTSLIPFIGLRNINRNNDTAGAHKKYEFENYKAVGKPYTEYPAVEERAVWLRPSNPTPVIR